MVNKMNIFEVPDNAPKEFIEKTQAMLNQHRKHSTYKDLYPESRQTSKRRIHDYRAGHISPNGRSFNQRHLEKQRDQIIQEQEKRNGPVFYLRKK